MTITELAMQEQVLHGARPRASVRERVSDICCQHMSTCIIHNKSVEKSVTQVLERVAWALFAYIGFCPHIALNSSTGTGSIPEAI
jgi:hypothetical protein